MDIARELFSLALGWTAPSDGSRSGSDLDVDVVDVGGGGGDDGERLLSVCIYDFMRVLYSRQLPRQLACDLPRLRCTVNGRRVRTTEQLRAAVAAVNESYVHSLVPFATQTVMALPLRLLHDAYGPEFMIVDARGPLDVSFVVCERFWTVRAVKRLRVLPLAVSTAGARPVDVCLVDVCVVYECLAASVMIYSCEVGEDGLAI